MGLKVNFASLSFGASVDQQTGNLSVFDLIEEIRTPQVPVTLQSLVIALALEKTSTDKVDGKLFIHILTPDGKQNLVGTGDMQIPAEQKRMRAVFRFGGFPINSFGSHRFVLSCVNSSGAKQGEAILDFDVVRVTQVAQGIPPTERPPMAH
jgi:hypothetical protein